MRKYSDIVHRAFTFAASMSYGPSNLSACLMCDQKNKDHWRLSERDWSGQGSAEYSLRFVLNNDEACDFIEVIDTHKIHCYVDDRPLRKQRANKST